jgi:hypothetical protein
MYVGLKMMPLSTVPHFSVVCAYRDQVDRCSYDPGGSPKRQVCSPLETEENYATRRKGKGAVHVEAHNLNITMTSHSRRIQMAPRD